MTMKHPKVLTTRLLIFLTMALYLFVCPMGSKSELEAAIWHVNVAFGDDANPGNSTGFPFKSIQRACDAVEPGDTVIDLYSGTFTTARVCKRLGINCYSIEQSEYYCDMGRKEMSESLVLIFFLDHLIISGL